MDKWNHSSNSTIDLRNISLTMLRSLTTRSVVIGVASFVGVLTNLFVLLTIASSKKLHNRSQFLIFSLSISETIYNLSAIVVTGRTAWYGWNEWADVRTASDCVGFVLPWFVSSKVSLYFILFLGIDRLICVSAPLAYKRLPPTKYVLGVNAICWGLTLCHIPFLFLDNDTSIIVPLCSYVLIFSPTYTRAESTQSSVISVVILLIYTAAIANVATKYWSKRWTDAAERISWARRIKLSAFKSMATVGVIYLAFYGLATAGAYVTTWFVSRNAAVIVSPYIALLLCVSSTSHFAVYIILGSVFRESFLDLIRCKSKSSWAVGVETAGGNGGD